MKRKNSLFAVFLAVTAASCVVFMPLRSYGQMTSIGPFIQSGKIDANLLAKSYLSPIGEGFGPTLNAGWINSAKPHKLLGFDLSLRIGVSVVPSSNQTFNAAQIGLQNLSVKQGDSPITPTISGPNHSGTTLNASTQNYSFGSITLPQGTGFAAIPAPMIQGSIGLIKGTEVMFRFLPKTSVHNYGDMQLWGVGLHHSINQWIPGGKMLPVNLSVFAAYTKFKSNSPLNIQPDPNQNYSSPPPPSSTWAGQAVNSNTSAFTINAIAGKSLPFIGFFAGVGYEKSNVKINTPGNYPVTVPDPTHPGQMMIETLTHPISFTMNGANSFRGLIGLQLKLAFFHINAEYVLAKYQVLSTGISFSFR